MPPALRLDVQILELRTKHPFVIARGGQSDHRTVWVRITDGDGQEGWGEAAPSKFYGETPESVVAALGLYGTMLPDDPFNLEDAERRWENKLRGNAAARAALSSALHDLVGKRTWSAAGTIACTGRGVQLATRARPGSRGPSSI